MPDFVPTPEARKQRAPVSVESNGEVQRGNQLHKFLVTSLEVMQASVEVMLFRGGDGVTLWSCRCFSEARFLPIARFVDLGPGTCTR